MTIKYVFNKLILLSALSLSQLASANDVGLVANPATWRLQNYAPDNLVLWWTGSPCGSNQKLTTGNLSPSDKSRLYATILAAKMTSKKIYVYYDDTNGANGNCAITSFGMDTGN